SPCPWRRDHREELIQGVGLGGRRTKRLRLYLWMVTSWSRGWGPLQGMTRDVLGDVELILKTSKRPLEEDERGISVFSRGIWHATTLAGSEGKDMSHYIFGEIDVPRLEDDTSPIPPSDVSRSIALNPNNEL